MIKFTYYYGDPMVVNSSLTRYVGFPTGQATLSRTPRAFNSKTMINREYQRKKKGKGFFLSKVFFTCNGTVM